MFHFIFHFIHFPYFFLARPLDQKLKPESGSGSGSGSPRALAKKYSRDRLEAKDDEDDDEEANLVEAEDGEGMPEAISRTAQ